MKATHKSFVIVFTLILISCFAVQIHGKKKREAVLNHLFHASLKNASGVDTSHFQAPEHLDESRFHSQDGSKEEDRIQRWPGQPNVGFSQYGGYVTVDKSAGRALYYYFAEAQTSKESLPLLLWLNGGPGCSSLAYGAMQELGPFRVHSDGKTLYKNKFAWNYAANVLFLESPAGVGFSYSNRSSDYDKSGDKQTAEDNYVFLRNWLERFPEYKDREFYISGESYAGHYVPQLAYTVLYHNKKANKAIINLKGILIGNPVINDETDTIGVYDYYGSHALISQEAAQILRKYCDNSSSAGGDPKCSAAINESNRDTSNINIYNIYGPICTQPSITSKPKKGSLTSFDPCSDYYVYNYLNLPEVQESIHANVTKLKHDWQPCSNIIQSWLDSPSTVIPLIQEFMANGLRVWIFSGDNDGVIPVTSTEYSLQAMKLHVKTGWHPWYINGEVGGYTEEYKGNLTFATVRGAGHEVPSYQPLRALSLIKHFVDGTGLPDIKD
ncbi:hypothetical protein K2173_011387 [Erythroxylum novogranatense]|uniref:Carboxypeptidase n=1 Tax=Erythroxylum novogranatense TaxID=1862640 RepID=A0AAV8S9W5_9ROSI|nr:hypothetical protein K2173_011387 [Erythroxylum novogranatense]